MVVVVGYVVVCCHQPFFRVFVISPVDMNTSLFVQDCFILFFIFYISCFMYFCPSVIFLELDTISLVDWDIEVETVKLCRLHKNVYIILCRSKFHVFTM